MKKIVLFGLFLGCFIFTGCLKQQSGEGGEFYAENLIIKGVGPEISFEPTVEDGTLVLGRSFEDMSLHVFLSKGMWEKYLKNESDYLPGNEVTFKGTVEAIDSAAGNHYYNVKTIDKLELVKYPDVDKIKEIFDGYNYCESDSDCEYFMGECPLGCYIPMNKKFIDVSHNIVTNFINNIEERCVYGCVAMDKSVCKNYKCEMINSESNENNESISCTPEQKNADVCTMQYEPVCGSDSRTYGNSCVACQSETVESYTMGECGSSAFTIEGDSDYLQVVMEILEKDGAVSCDYSYDDNGTTVYGKFMADGNRFYSAAENQDYVLATGDKTYFWSSSSASEKIVIDSPADVESGIASLLMDKGNYSDFQINCSGGIEDENLFKVN